MPAAATTDLEKTKSSGSRHWAIERGLATASLVLVPAAVFVPSAPVDYALGVVLPLHAYYGLEVRISRSRSVSWLVERHALTPLACYAIAPSVSVGAAQSSVIDYLPKRRVGMLHHIALNSVRLATALTMYGLYELNANDIGITNAVKALWSI